MATNYSGAYTPTLSNAPASSWTTEADKRNHVGNTFLNTSSKNVYAFEYMGFTNVVKSATVGSVVSFSDAVGGEPLISAIAALSPVQSLNGYTKPWAAGAGKNIWDLASRMVGQTNAGGNSSVYYFLNDGIVSISANTADDGRKMFSAQSLAAGTYTFSAQVSMSGSTDRDIAYSARDMTSLTDIKALSYIYGIVNGTRASFTFTISATTNVAISFQPRKPGGGTLSFTDIQLESGSPATAYEPYENICPITGNSTASIWVAASHDTTLSPTETASLGTTIYGGTYDFVSGKLKQTMANIASYNGETIGEPWLSSLDEYVSGNTPTTGAQVVYTLSTPVTTTLTGQTIAALNGQNYVWADTGNITELKYTSTEMANVYQWNETWVMPKITRNNGTVIVLPYPQEYTPDIYDVDASTTGRNAAGTMIRDRVARKHKFNYKFAALTQAEVTEILGAVQDVSFTLTTASPETGAKTNYTVYCGDRSMPVYWMPTSNNSSWMYSTLSVNLIEM